MFAARYRTLPFLLVIAVSTACGSTVQNAGQMGDSLGQIGPAGPAAARAPA